MSEILAKGTHYMTFPHTLDGRVRDDFDITLIKNGEITKDVPVEIREVKTNLYVASFENDGTNNSNWSLTITDPEVENVYYVESWQVKRNTVEKTLNTMRANQEASGDGGRFGGRK